MMAEGELGKVFNNWEDAEDTMEAIIKTYLNNIIELPEERLTKSDRKAIIKSRAKKCSEIIVQRLQQQGYYLKKEVE